MNGFFYNWYWFPVMYLIFRHVFWACHTIYMHRTVIHKTIKPSKAFELFSRIVLWLGLFHFYQWNRVIFFNHNYHHENSDCEVDPTCPRRFTFMELYEVKNIPNGHHQPWWHPPEYEQTRSGAPEPFNDRLEHFFNKYQYGGNWVMGIICLILYGPFAMPLGMMFHWWLNRIWHTWVGLYATHGAGTSWWINYKSPFATPDLNRKAVNYFPIGLFHSGEELHSNHHCRPGSAKFSHRWWELDMGWVYIKILEKFGLLKVLKVHTPPK